jgi:hypothetical protein
MTGQHTGIVGARHAAGPFDLLTPRTNGGEEIADARGDLTGLHSPFWYDDRMR